MNRITLNFAEKPLKEIDKVKVVTAAFAELEEIYRVLNVEKPTITVEIMAEDGTISLEI